MPDARKDWLGGTANIQFLAMMLRLGDVIHFDSKRAPRSLYAEKQITDAVSYKHWNAKFQELQYKVQNTNGKVIICYMMYPYMTLADETEIIHSQIIEKDGMEVKGA